MGKKNKKQEEEEEEEDDIRKGVNLSPYLQNMNKT
jgi:hypothetical protein